MSVLNRVSVSRSLFARRRIQFEFWFALIASRSSTKKSAPIRSLEKRFGPYNKLALLKASLPVFVQRRAIYIDSNVYRSTLNETLPIAAMRINIQLFARCNHR